MTKIEEAEIKLADAKLHKENAKAYIQLYGLSDATLNIYLDACRKVVRLTDELAYLKSHQG